MTVNIEELKQEIKSLMSSINSWKKDENSDEREVDMVKGVNSVLASLDELSADVFKMSQQGKDASDIQKKSEALFSFSDYMIITCLELQEAGLASASEVTDKLAEYLDFARETIVGLPDEESAKKINKQYQEIKGIIAENNNALSDQASEKHEESYDELDEGGFVVVRPATAVRYEPKRAESPESAETSEDSLSDAAEETEAQKIYKIIEVAVNQEVNRLRNNGAVAKNKGRENKCQRIEAALEHLKDRVREGKCNDQPNVVSLLKSSGFSGEMGSPKWQESLKDALSHHRNVFSRFFSKEPSQSYETVLTTSNEAYAEIQSDEDISSVLPPSSRG